MADSLGDVVAGALYQQLRLGVISNNMANANTVGFKKDQVVFNPLIAEPLTDEQALAATSSMDPELFAANTPARTFTDFEQGHMVSTGNKLDMAIQGKGFFCIETPGGSMYTRSGNFALNDQNELCTTDGYPILGQSGRITLENSDFQVDGTGNILSGGATVNTLKIVNFEEGSLLKNGENKFKPVNPEIQETPAEDYSIEQGFVEQSNVNTVKMMTEMIETLRGYETYQKVITQLNETTLLAINSVGEVP